MKTIKILLFSLSIILLSSSEILSDNVEFRLIESFNGGAVGTEFHVDLQMRISSGTSPRTLNSITADVYYGSRLSEWPLVNGSVGTNWGPGSEYTRNVNRNSGYYRVLITNSSVNFNGNLTPPGNPPGWDVTSSYQTIVTLRWIIASLGTENVSIDDNTDAAAYFSNYTNAPQGSATDWIVTNNDLETATPVELSTFNAKLNGSNIELLWQTKTEVNNYGFEIERASSLTSSIQGWEKIGFVAGSGNSNSPKDYSFTDNNPYGGNKFIYRLKQIDNDGKFEYSDEVEVEIVPNEFALYQNYPNPFNPATNIQFSLPKATRINLSVYNLLGEKIATLLNEDKEAGFYNVQFDASSFSSGVYIYRLTTGDFIKTMKMNFIK
jgi:hypothetical protein